MTAEHRFWREQLGAFVLGMLSDDDAAAVRAHLDGCPQCRADHAELVPLVEPLSRVDPDAVSAALAPPPHLGGQIVAAVNAERDSRRRARLVRITGSLAAAALLVAVVVLVTPRRAPAPTEPVVVQVERTGVNAEASLIAHTWGTEIILVADGLTAGASYSVSFQRAGGETVSAGTFIGVGEKPLTCRLNAAVLRDDAESFTVTDAAGEVVMRGDL